MGTVHERLRMKMNTNCLKGMKCPKCWSEGPFSIRAEATFVVTDHGTDDVCQDVEWSDTSHCSCHNCGHDGSVGSFNVEDV